MRFREVKEKDLEVGKVYYDVPNEDDGTALRFSAEEDGRIYFVPVTKQTVYFPNKKGLIPFVLTEGETWYEKIEN